MSERAGGEFWAFISGVFIGGIVAALFSPKSGPELRKEIARTAEEYGRKADEFIETGRVKTDELIKESRVRADELIQEGKEKAEKLIEEAKVKIEEMKKTATRKNQPEKS